MHPPGFHVLGLETRRLGMRRSHAGIVGGGCQPDVRSEGFCRQGREVA
jgi:hypothetical protein